ncbi:hypothetical protein Lser_V15G05966 [Lactuca serriola]
MLDGIRKRFLWVNDGEKRKINLVSWDLVTKPKREGGPGVDSLESANLALLAKWWQRLKNEGGNSFWSSCIKSIHKLKLIDDKPIAKNSIKGVWLSISQMDVDLHD